MPLETVVFVSCVCAMFAIFIAALAYASTTVR